MLSKRKKESVGYVDIKVTRSKGYFTHDCLKLMWFTFQKKSTHMLKLKNEQRDGSL